MTLPALPIPNVTPGPLQQAPGFADQVQPGLSALANLLALRQRQSELAQQKDELAFRVAQAQQEARWRDETGEAVRQSLLGLDTTFGQALLPAGPLGGLAPVSIPQPGPLARAVVNAPPGAAYDLARVGSGILAETFRPGRRKRPPA